MPSQHNTGTHPFFMTSQHNAGIHPFYIGMYIHICTHIYVHIYILLRRNVYVFFHEGFWTSRSPSPSDHPAHANQPADQSTVCEGKSETHKGSFKLWTSNKSLTSSKNSVPADPTLAVEANLFAKDVQYWKLRPT